MLGWKLFLRALTLLIDNLAVALRVSAIPYGMTAAASLWLSTGWPEVNLQAIASGALQPPPGFASAALLVLVVTIVSYLWVAVAWHRYVLLGEAPSGWLPPLRGSLMLGYLGRFLLVALVTLLVVLAIATMISALLVPIVGAAALILVNAAAFLLGLIVFYRCGLILPAGTIEKSMTLNEAIVATKGQSGTVIVLALLTLVFSWILQIPAILDGAGNWPLISAIYQIVVNWIGLLLGVGTLTALYGHVVEGRPVD
ncbi:MAG: hypothetical protein AAF919_12245 [Pseudomonadota bacterium]